MKKLIQFIYRYLPFKQQIFKLIRPFNIPKSIYQHLHFKGTIRVKVGNSTFLMQHHGFQLENEIFWAGLTNGWEKESIKLWIKLCSTAEIVIDIGANTGIYSLVAKTVNPYSKVYAFEPVERVFLKMKENILLNNFDIVAVEKAASNFDGTAVIYDIPSEHIYSVAVNKNLFSTGTQVIETKIDTITLNSFIKQNNIKKIDLIKIDVETHEPEVLEGFSDYLNQFKPTLLIEILNDEVGQKVDNLIQNKDYLYFNIDEKGGIRQVDKITKSDYYNYLLCNKDIATKIGLIKEH